MRSSRPITYLLVACAGSLLAGACDYREIEPLHHQARYNSYAPTTLFSDGRIMRMPIAGTVVRPPAATPATHPLTIATLEQGQQAFDINCGACHGLVGDGRSVAGEKMALRPPPSLHEERIRAFSAAKLLRVIDQGYGLMPSYRAALSENERTAVAHYVRALQLSQRAQLDDVPPEERRRFATEVQGK